MNVALRRPETTEEFLAWEERQERRHESDGFAPRATVGVTIAHSAIQRNLLITLGNGLRGKRRQPHGSEVKIPIPSGQIRYPDAFEDWISDLLAGPDAVLRPLEIEREIPLSELYRRLEFDPEAGADRTSDDPPA